MFWLTIHITQPGRTTYSTFIEMLSLPVRLWNDPGRRIGKYSHGDWDYDPQSERVTLYESNPYTGEDRERVIALKGVSASLRHFLCPLHSGMYGVGVVLSHSGLIAASRWGGDHIEWRIS